MERNEKTSAELELQETSYIRELSNSILFLTSGNRDKEDKVTEQGGNCTWKAKQLSDRVNDMKDRELPVVVIRDGSEDSENTNKKYVLFRKISNDELEGDEEVSRTHRMPKQTELTLSEKPNSNTTQSKAHIQAQSSSQQENTHQTGLKRETSDPGAFHVRPGEPLVAAECPGPFRSISLNFSPTQQQEDMHVPHQETIAADNPSPDSVSEEGTQQSEQVQEVVAFEVDPHKEEENVRRRIIDEAVVAQVVERRNKTKWMHYILALFVILGVALVVSFRVDKSTNRSSDGVSSEVTLVSTLESIMQSDVIRCGVPDFPMFYDVDEATGRRKSFEIDLCRALAAATLGDPDKHKLVDLALIDRFVALSNRSIDVYVRATFNMERDVFEHRAHTGFTFTTPYYYGKIIFGGIPEYVHCADALKIHGNCSDLMVCVGEGTTHEETLELMLPKSRIVSLPLTDIIAGFMAGACNVLIGVDWDMTKFLVVDAVFGPGYVAGSTVLGYEGLAIVTSDDDPHWSDKVNWILQALMIAEEQGVTKNTTTLFETTSVFEHDREGILHNAVAAVGNYGELYELHYERIIPRGVNVINTNATSGVFLSPDVGMSSAIGPAPAQDGSIKRIAEKGYLVCGINGRRPGFAEFDDDTGEWRGMDVDFCRALAGSLFFGKVVSNETLTFLELNQPQAGALALANGTVDVLCGAKIDLLNDEIFSFSHPYYYTNDRPGDVRALATKQGDPQWSSFSYWVVASTIYAEARNITRFTSNLMPTVGLFGSNYQRMFRDAILSVGNYGEMYRRNLESTIPRRGLNLLNGNQVGPLLRPYHLQCIV